ncbi:MAG: hypothetical protein A3I88_00765 [Candidatus Portnoybacteria bacterium RIFCSPLOWO2_12_FULL_39_9]|uniref:Uncharacterized protein n=1 Tax=Candidatus Portnoybacteria bacterium RIFCSPHIGHO2_12_FULL_38_9 TaxID=1801997 RepID=A0A1G2FE20_9BACT|nr:MAG: hypothetical protein A3H00_02575 [Candidatus Portnoybacteria bacterium RBG_13_40_8]OGZ35640.1 MAG: hypothetical protein A2646_01185 [Candidatus Portnoybacteria bacterium RIFCSPHIGHO2_02_FULL_39_12]OGZ36293.1 MAG: hypothetical protein A3J64_03015 [Candidatus Portnoybacteria bacterium RIFCSPHIGHO2_12_FULL_38_9]OGZ38768.1 MAG: hypothetical protein A3F21_03400 [Candidatus Portnoybacteria bacterium RIFCSPLOWO2_01_FULL_38_39]OGZ40757.1 MAG: hypothetical protein A3I88_00765 [Candidatus Portnoy
MFKITEQGIKKFELEFKDITPPGDLTGWSNYCRVRKYIIEKDPIMGKFLGDLEKDDPLSSDILSALKVYALIMVQMDVNRRVEYNKLWQEDPGDINGYYRNDKIVTIKVLEKGNNRLIEESIKRMLEMSNQFKLWQFEREDAENAFQEP